MIYVHYKKFQIHKSLKNVKITQIPQPRKKTSLTFGEDLSMKHTLS